MSESRDRKTEQLQNWLQIAGLGGVILSLIFVGLEIQQSRQIAIADIYQQRTALVMHAQTSNFSPELFIEARRKREAGEELDSSDEVILETAMDVWVSYHENNHFQNQMGLLPDEHWETGRNHLRQLMRLERNRAWWEEHRDVYRDSFAAEVDQIIREEPARD